MAWSPPHRVYTGGSPGTASTTTSAHRVHRPDAAGSVWLCRPGPADDPCAASLDTTVVQASGSCTIKRVVAPSSSRFDCFYLYPAVTSQTTDNANLMGVTGPSS